MLHFDSNIEDRFVTYEQVFTHPEVDVVLLYLPKYEKEFVPSVPVTTNEHGDIQLSSLVETLKAMKFPLDTSMLFYYSQTSGMYVYCGNDPLPSHIMLPACEIAEEGNRKIITLRARIVETFEVPRLEHDIELETAALVDLHSEISQEPEADSSPNEKGKRKRHKERKIGEVLDLVLKWRKLYSGVRDPRNGQIVKLSLEDAAKKLGVAKKSLDDYLLQIRFARKFGFNFQEYQNERVGVLRSYVKRMKSENKDFKDDTSDIFSDDNQSVHSKVSKSKRSKKIQKFDL